MTTYGVTTTGFVPEPLAQSQADIFAALQAAFGADIDPSPTMPFGLLAALLAARESTLWQMGQGVYSAAYPDSANGSQLDDVCALTGVVRLGPLPSTVNEVLIGTNGTVVPAATVFATSTAAVPFQTVSPATIATLSAWAANTAYAVGAIVTMGGNVYCVINAGTSAISTAWTINQTWTTGQQIVANGNLYYCASGGLGSSSGTGPSGTGSGIIDNLATWNYVSAAGGPTGTSTSILDNNVIWYYCGAGTAAVLAPCVSTTTGPFSATSGVLTVISTPVSGLTSVVNPIAAVVGNNQETDAALRLRRSSLTQAQGKSPVPSLAAALLKVSGVTGVQVIENPTDTTDGFGRPPHSFECVVLGGLDSAVATAIFQNKAAGANTYGTYTPQSVTDPLTGVVYTINFTRPTAVPIYIIVNLKKGTAWPTNGVALAQAAIIAWSTGGIAALGTGAFVPGGSVYSGPIGAAIFDQMPGLQVNDITSVYIGIAANPSTSTPITIAYNQLATFDPSRITVNPS